MRPDARPAFFASSGVVELVGGVRLWTSNVAEAVDRSGLAGEQLGVMTAGCPSRTRVEACLYSAPSPAYEAVGGTLCPCVRAICRNSNRSKLNVTRIALAGCGCFGR